MPAHEPPRKKPDQSIGHRIELERKGIGGKSSKHIFSDTISMPREYKIFLAMLKEKRIPIDENAHRTIVYEIALKSAKEEEKASMIEAIIKAEMSHIELVLGNKPKRTIREKAINNLKNSGILKKDFKDFQKA